MTDQPDAAPPDDDRDGDDHLPADPARYDEYRNVAARRRGLERPYIAGGEDPHLDETVRAERPYLRLLLLMVAVLVAMGFVLGIAGVLITGR